MATWVNIKSIMLSQRSQSQKANYGMVPIIPHSRKDKTKMMGKRSMLARGQG